MNGLINDITNRRNQTLNGLVNCIPYNINKMNQAMYGIERGKYWIVTANTKVGKTQLTDYLFVYNLLQYAYINKDILDFRIKIKYLCLEESKLEKQYRLLCHFLNLGNTKRISLAELQSLQTALDEDTLNKIISKSSILNYYDSIIEYVENLSTANSIINYLKNLALVEGQYNEETGEYIRHRPQDYVLIILDNFNLILSDNFNRSIMDSIGTLSSFVVNYKKTTNFSFVGIQQQAATAENIQALQYRDGIPTLDNLADNKKTGRDANYVFGLYSPYRNRILNHEGISVGHLKDSYRALYILADRDYGNIGTFIRLFFDGSYTFFNELNNLK